MRKVQQIGNGFIVRIGPPGGKLIAVAALFALLRLTRLLFLYVREAGCVALSYKFRQNKPSSEF